MLQFGSTALHCAATYGQTASVRELLRAQADPTLLTTVICLLHCCTLLPVPLLPAPVLRLCCLLHCCLLPAALLRVPLLPAAMLSNAGRGEGRRYMKLLPEVTVRLQRCCRVLLCPAAQGLFPSRRSLGPPLIAGKRAGKRCL